MGVGAENRKTGKKNKKKKFLSYAIDSNLFAKLRLIKALTLDIVAEIRRLSLLLSVSLWLCFY